MGFLSDAWDKVKDIGKSAGNILSSGAKTVLDFGKSFLGFGTPAGPLGINNLDLGSLIGPALNLAGDLWGQKMASDAYKPPEVDWTGAKMGVRWRVNDAKAAGIHPLYALGAPGVGSGAVIGGTQEPNYGAAVQNLGQNLSYLASERSQLNNQLLAAQIRKLDAETAAIASSPPTDTNAVPFRGNYMYEMFQGEDGKYKRTSPESRMDISEALGPGVDAWIQNPDKRPEIEEKMVKNVQAMPGVRHSFNAYDKARSIVDGFLDKVIELRYGDPTAPVTQEDLKTYRKIWR